MKQYLEHFWRLTALLAFAGVLGWQFGWAAEFMFAALLVFVISHKLAMMALLDWLHNRPDETPPENSGTWGEVFDGLHRLQIRRRKQRKELGDTVRQFEMSAEAMPDGVVLLDRDWRIVYFNKSASQLLGLRRTVDEGQYLLNMLRSPEFGRYLREKRFQESVTLPAPDQLGRQLSVQLIPISENERLLLTRDITEIEQFEQTRRDFIANASHELRTPLTVVRGYLDMFKGNSEISSEYDEVFDAMRTQTQRMELIIRDLMTLMRLDGQVDPRKDVELDMAAILENDCADAQRVADESQGATVGVALTVELDADAEFGLLGQTEILESVVSNLLFNAVNYSPNGGTIQVSWWVQETGEGVLSIRDQGIGISAEQIPRLTERFYRVNASKHRVRVGTGLGLAIVKHGLQHHRAHLEIDSELGVGSEFRCVFPADRVIRLPEMVVTKSS